MVCRVLGFGFLKRMEKRSIFFSCVTHARVCVFVFERRRQCATTTTCDGDDDEKCE